MIESGRRRARRLAFETLFELEARNGRSTDETLGQRRAVLEEETGRALPKGSVEFVRELVLGTQAHRSEIRAKIGEVAPAFPVEQLATTDRVALEMAIFELLYYGDAPTRVVINEAVELAKTFGGENSGRFVNGVLGTIAEGLAESGAATEA